MNQGKSVLFLSNGRGEDVIAKNLIRAIRRLYPHFYFHALPLVGEGETYAEYDVPRLCHQKEPPSGGFLFETKQALIKDIFHGGILSTLISQFCLLRKTRGEFDVVVCVGDILPVVLSYLALGKKCIFIQTAKSVRKSSFSPMEIAFLKISCKMIFIRDAETENYFLEKRLPVSYLGNPMMDVVLEDDNLTYSFEGNPNIVALLPGSRRESVSNFTKMLAVVESFSTNDSTLFMAALSANLPLSDFQDKAGQRGWRVLEFKQDEANVGVLSLLISPQGHRLFLTKNHFVKVLRSCKYVIGLAGMANEVACGMGKPVFTFEGYGPQTTKKRFQKQEKILLGGAKFIEGDVASVAQMIQKIVTAEDVLRRLGVQGKISMGESGASEKIASTIIEYLREGKIGLRHYLQDNE